MRRPRSRRNAVVVGVLTAVLAFVATVQLRSQAEVQRTLEGEDPAALAFLIDDLHRANDSLGAEAIALAGQRDMLQSGGAQDATTQLSAEADRLGIIDGSVAVHGPGVTFVIDAPLSALDLQDAVNNLRSGGAEAVALNDRRVVTGTIIANVSGGVTIDGTPARGPWTMTAIGDPDRLQATGDLMTRSLRSDPRVRHADYRFEPDLAIRSTVAPRPFVYGTA
jgi:uncharacterized protein YlxW (UPF0749 family)